MRLATRLLGEAFRLATAHTAATGPLNNTLSPILNGTTPNPLDCNLHKIESFYSSEAKCHFVRHNCKELIDYMRMFTIYFCYLDESMLLVGFLTIFGIIYLLRLLEYTSDNFVATTLTKFAKYMKLSQAMAGATLVAFSNGTTDLATVIVSSANPLTEGDDLVIGDLVGASIFAMLVVLGYIVLKTKKQKIKHLERANFMVILGVYLISITTFLILGFFHTQYWLIAMIFLSLYSCFVYYLYKQEVEKNKKGRIEALGIEDPSTYNELMKTRVNSQHIPLDDKLATLSKKLPKRLNPETSEFDILEKQIFMRLESHYDEHPAYGEDTAKQSEKNGISTKPISDVIYESVIPETPFEHNAGNNGELVPDAEERFLELLESQGVEFGEDQELLEPQAAESHNKPVFRKLQKIFMDEWNSRTDFQRAVYLVELPMIIIIHLTIPPVNSALFHKYQIHIYPFTSITFLLFFHKVLFGHVNILGLEMPGYALNLVLGAILTIPLLFVPKDSWKASPRKVFLLISVTLGILWIEFLVNSIIDIVVFLRVMTDRSELFMGMTVMAISNTFFDMCVNASLAAEGYEIMAVTGLFAGQMFNFLVGFGLSCFIKFFGPSAFKTFNLYNVGSWKSDKQGQMTFYLLVWMLVVIVFLMLVLLKNKFSFGRKEAYICFLIYTAMFCFMLTEEIILEKQQNRKTRKPKSVHSMASTLLNFGT